MESVIRSNKVTFEALQLRLLKFVTHRVQNGEYTERGLARVLGISQSQIHNVLKGARGLRPELADRILRKFDLSASDLLTKAELMEALEQKSGSGSVERLGGWRLEAERPAAAKRPMGWIERRLEREKAG